MDFVHRPHPVEVKEERSGSGGGGFAHWRLQNSVADFHIYNDTRKNPLYQELSSPKHAIQPNEQTNKINEYCYLSQVPLVLVLKTIENCLVPKNSESFSVITYSTP
jgi:hypothetical protein